MLRLIVLVMFLTLLPTGSVQAQSNLTVPKKADGALRVATFNVSLNRKAAGQLRQNLESDHSQAQAIAAIIRAVQPDIILLNELDWQSNFDNAALFAERYLASDKPDLLGSGPWKLEYRYSAPVNTGVDSGIDLNGNGKLHEPEDAWGFGSFPGQYGMAVLSRFPINSQQVRTFQNLKWSAMPGALQPLDPKSQAAYYPEETWKQLRLSSKSHWDVPIDTPLGTLSVLASHPTPPAFDGPADHNGCRNHDEIRLLADYINSDPDHYIVDDVGNRGGLATTRAFVVLGDLNSDPVDGESRRQAIENLLKNPRVNSIVTPESPGAIEAGKAQGQANDKHKGHAKYDTADFSDKVVGNLRVDYVLPSSDFKIVTSGVFWLSEQASKVDPKTLKRLMNASDHHLVWVDIAKP